MDIEQARFNMVEQQIRTWDVLDPDILGLLFEVKRERFVPEAHRDLAFADLEVPLAHGEAMWQPKLEARVVQELSIGPGDSIYEVGTGSGHLTALLARRGKHVTTVEIHPDLQAEARTRLATEGIGNVSFLEGDGAREPLGESAYDVIVLTGSTPVLPEAFAQRLNPGGRLFAVVGDLPVMKALIVRRGDAAGAAHPVVLFETVLKPLAHAAQPSRFRF